MKLSNQKRLAADILKVGRSRVWINPERLEDVEEVITRAEIRKLVHEGVIKALPKKGVSRARAKQHHMKRKKGLGRGHGSRKGTKTARNSRKDAWINRIRAIRKHLKELVNRRVIQRNIYRRLYNLSKGGVFENIGEVDRYIEDHQLTRKR
ncbi:MAG: 50S ribosomal protein L19e [Candidatus Ranarchaeia archaeon]